MKEISLKSTFFLEAKEYKLRKNYNMTGYYPLHWHEYYEIEICLDGEGIEKLNGTEYRMRQGTVTFLRMTDFHEYTFTTPCKILCIDFSGKSFSGNFFRELIKTRHDIITTFEGSEWETLKAIADIFIDEYDSERKYRSDAIEKIIDYICLIMLRKTKSAVTRELTDGNNQIKRALEYIDIHFREDLSLEQVADIAGYSKNYFSQRFINIVGVTFSQYLQRKRITYSKMILRSTEHSVIDISIECGYSSLSNFNRAFKMETGMSPSDYRKHKLKEK